MSAGSVTESASDRNGSTVISRNNIKSIMGRKTTFKFQYLKVTHKVCDVCAEDLHISKFHKQWRNEDGSKKKEPHEDTCKRCAMERIKAALAAEGHKVTGTDDDQMHNVY